ncbi:hypothetical protein CspeluHIS016_0108490 [Cutaneotrichosporon spelunceum]|uniref:Uncharacterized protein n=1 Tax=Cutaneotrichosporon spelunceum TaxID=1672016 RepID=A0AAD3Y9R8_9TREE|nr:hypothetical protein CspeluHIS016_0108490 [Cutaneotrichosporon spelunceum]
MVLGRASQLRQSLCIGPSSTPLRQSETALDGVIPWSEVGGNGIYLALVDFMLQCRDHLHVEMVKSSIRHILDPSEPEYLTYPAWRAARESEMERIYSLKDASTGPPRADIQRIPASFLGQYDPGPEQLERHAMCLVQGSISLDTDEGAILRSVAAL